MTAPATTQDDPFSRFVRDTFDTVSRCAVGLCRNETLAKDLTQESFIKVMMTPPAPAEELKVGHALRALKWAATDQFRKEARERRLIEKIGRLEIDRLITDPSEQVLDRDLLLRLMEKLELGYGQQEILLLTKFGGFKAAEVGEILGIAEGTVRNHLTVIRTIARERFSGM